MAKDQDEPMTNADAEDKKQKPAPKKPNKKKGEEDKPDLSDEDLELKANLEMMVERIRDSDPAVQSSALENISRYAPGTHNQSPELRPAAILTRWHK